MQNKIAFIIITVILMQFVYSIAKSAKDRYNSGNTYIKGTAYIRGLITIVLLVLLIVFMMI